MLNTRVLVERALKTATDTSHLTLDAGAITLTATAFRASFGERPAVVVADPTTWSVAAQHVEQVLRRAGLATRPSIVLSAPLHADFERVLSLEAAIGAVDAIPVAVGSGTINDLTKLAAHRLNRPYMVVATAASMDGYAAFGASITRDGFKQTMACPAPAGIVADLDVLAAAPTPLTAAGYGDLLGKVTAGADWIVADALEVEPIDPAAWEMVQGPLGAAIGSPERLRAHELAATEQFFLGLVISGLAMQATQSSRPASGAEHLISHLWEMTGLAEGPNPPSHGTKVGIGTVLVTMLYERLLAHDLSTIDVEACVTALPTAETVECQVRAGLPAGEVADRAVVESLAKHPTAEQLRARLTLLRERWPGLRERLQGQLLPPAELRRRLRALGAASLPGEIGVGPVRLRSDLLAARQIRRRYTMLDLAAEVGLLGRCVDEVVAAVAQSWGVFLEHDVGHSGRSGQDGRAPRGAPRADR
ncbi:MAG TPA: sn-glycerol-1-phosphate dehydrogenase [Chloroflexota bacterium]|nr:sn-glycerol-1-phosphate dehydrogenase [Chloroflexota bacterium]